jgi:hypothetical protein
MPHGGYHGTVKIGNNVVQTASQNPNTGQYEISGGIDDSSRLDFNPPQSNQNNQTAAQVDQQINQAIADQKDKEFDDKRAGVLAINAQQNLLSNLLRKEQEEALRNRILGQARPVEQVDIEQGFGITRPAKLNRSDLLGYEGGLFGLNTGPNIGGTTYPIAAETVNPFTGEKIITRKAREGLTTPQYNQFIQELYGANPELYQETFPFASGQIAKPILARIGEGIMKIPGASNFGQMAGDLFESASGIFSGKKTATPAIQYDNMGNPVGIISQLPESDGGGVNLQDFVNTPKLDLGQYSAIPEEYKGFFESEFAKPVAGGMAITYVTLPDGRRIRFGDTGSAAQFRKYLESIGVAPQEEPTEKVEVETPKEEKAPFDLAKFYAGLPNYSYGQQGVMNPNINPDLAAYFENLKKYYGVG